MGATKRIVEQILQSFNESRETIKKTRFPIKILMFGPLVQPYHFREQPKMEAHQVTDPQVTRYFMTIQEASQLVLQASGRSRQEIFIRYGRACKDSRSSRE